MFRKNYIPGANCGKELLITDDIFSVLEMFDKEISKTTKASYSAPKTASLIQSSLEKNFNREDLIRSSTNYEESTYRVNYIYN